MLAQFVVHHATDSNRTVTVEWLRCHYTCQIFSVGLLLVNCRYTAGWQLADSTPTVGRQTFRGAVLHFYRHVLILGMSLALNVCEARVYSSVSYIVLQVCRLTDSSPTFWILPQRLQRVCNNRVLVGKVVVCHIYDLPGLLGTAVPVIIMLNTLFYHCR